MRLKRRIWFLTEYFYPVCSSTGYYLTEIAKHLSSSGKDVSVISTKNKYRSSDFSPIQNYELYQGIKIYRASIARSDKKELFSRSIGMLQTTIRIFGLMILHIRKKDKIIAVTNPPLLIPCLYLFKLLFGVEYVIIVHDLFPANLVSANVLKKQSFFLKLVNCLYFFFYSRAALIISIGRDMQNIFEQNLPKKRPKLVTITNWSDDDVVYPIPRMKCNNIYKINLQGKIVLQFAGNIGKAQNIEILLKIAEYCKNDNIHIVFIGTGEKVELIRGYIKTSIRKNITLLDYIDRSSQCEFLNSCDIGIITLRDGMYGLGVPSKAYNILAAGKPILYIGDKGSEIFKLVCENDIGWAFQSSRYGEVIEMLSKLENSIDDIIRKGKNARKVAETLTSKKYILNEYLKVLE